ncbi:MAG: TadE/TadG family type IV pilus assembly protein [Bythopirellula sp.]
MMTNRVQRTLVRSGRNGLYAVELALTLPLLMVLLFGFYELARANLMRNLAQDAAYEAAREVIVAGSQASEAVQVASDILQVLGVNSPQVTVSPTTITPTTDEVAVTVSFPMQSITGIGNSFLSGLTLTGQCQLQREGFQDLSATLPPPPPPPPDDDDD